ncbi:MAG: hypothetical protein LBC34_01155, partial [Rickettsiales bacterium]|nr:hypothetical protein [Rickettsiales bacterium]
MKTDLLHYVYRILLYQNMLQLLILLAVITSVVFFGHLVPIEAKAFLYSVSLSIKEILLFIM